MAEIKRPNYFTSQFLVEKDFNDEQSYHLDARRRHNRVLHSGGVADGLDVTFFGARQVTVAAGTAIDRSGREIVLADPRTFTLTVASGPDVFLTIAYQDVSDPVDQDTQGLNEFTRVSERPLLQDSTVVPPAGSTAIVLARIRLNASGAIDSNGSIDNSVRAIASARVALKAIGTAQLADGAVSLDKLAFDAKPLAVRGTNAITVVTDNANKQITVGENHSARNDNPHATTAAQVDNQGGANRIATQINAGTGVITRPHVESAIVSGVVSFEKIISGIEVFSDEIDPGFGPGSVSVQFAIDDTPLLNPFPRSTSGDLSGGQGVQFRSELNRQTGRFRIFVSRIAGSPTGPASVRWFASRPTAGVDVNSTITVTVSPASANLVGNTIQQFTATVNNVVNAAGVTWSVAKPDGTTVGVGTLTNVSTTSVTYTPPGLSGLYRVTATSILDSTKKTSADINVNADLTVTVTPVAPTVFGGATQNLTATVVNNNNTAVTWALRETGGGTLSVTGNNATYTAPTAPGTYHVDAFSVVDTSRKGTATITVPAVNIGITTTAQTVFRGESIFLGATVGNSINTGITWSVTPGGGSVSPASGINTTYTAPTAPGTYVVTAKSVADQNKTATCTITVPPVTLAIVPDSDVVIAGQSTVIRGIVTGSSNTSVNWTSQSLAASVSPAVGNATTWFAPGVGGDFGVSASAVADTSRTASTSIHVPNVKSSGEGGGKFAPIQEFSKVDGPASTVEPTPEPTAESAPEPEATTDIGEQARSFVRPAKRPNTRLPRKPRGE